MAVKTAIIGLGIIFFFGQNNQIIYHSGNIFLMRQCSLEKIPDR